MKWALLLVITVLPLQWFVIPVGGLRLHLVVLLAFTALLAVRRRFQVTLPVLRVTAPFVGAMLLLAVVTAVTGVYHGDAPRAGIEIAVYVAVFVALATVVYRAGRGLEPGSLAVLRWTGLACNVVLITALSASMLSNAVDPLGVFGQTIASADPNILQSELYRSAFVGFGLDDNVVRSQLRHEIFAAVLVALYVSLAAVRLQPLRSPSARLLFRLSTAVSVVLVILSLSRAVTLAALAWPLWAGLRALRSGEHRVGAMATALSTAVLLLGVGASGFLGVVWTRFTQDTSSYESRSGLLRQAFDNIGTHWATGGIDTVGESSHNFVLDYWLRTGLAGALTALFVLGLVAGLLMGFLGRVHREPAWVVPALSCLSLVLVRMFTAGGGAIPPVEWVALAVAAGLMTLRADQLSERSPDAAEPVTAVSPAAGRRGPDEVTA